MQQQGNKLCEEALAGVPEKSPDRLRVVFAGTHPCQFNGYSRVTYELCKRLAADKETETFVFGFQRNRPGVAGGGGLDAQEALRRLPSGVHVYDAAACEDPTERGFGTGQLDAYLRVVRPDVFVVYNDPIVVNKCAAVLVGLPEDVRKGVAFVPYLDQIYMHLKPGFVETLNKHATAVVCFTPYWEQVFADQGGRVPTAHLRHGFEPSRHFPVPRELARLYFGLKPDDFVVLNLNRNQPRKRWDVCLKAWAEFVHRRVSEGSAGTAAAGGRQGAGETGRPAKLLIATSLTGAWNLLEIYDRELGKRGIAPDEGRKHLIMLTAPQAMTDAQINILYSVADVGINTADGEGFGLCTFEHAGVGVPQVASRVGGIRDFLDDGCATLCDEVYRYYVDESRDHVGGEAQLVDPYDVYSGMNAYYSDGGLAAKHGEESRKRIAYNADYSWDRLAERFSDILHEAHRTNPFGRKVSGTGISDVPLAKLAASLVAESDESAGMDGAGERPAGAPITAHPSAAESAEARRVDEGDGYKEAISSLRAEICELKLMLIDSLKAPRST